MIELLDSPAVEAAPLRIADDRIEVFPDARAVVVDGVEAPIQGYKFDVLALLASQPDRTVSIPAICETVWDDGEGSAVRPLLTHVARLRRLLGEELGDPTTGAIVNKRRLGYRAVSSLAPRVVLPGDEEGSVYLIADQRVAVNPEAGSVRSDGRLVEEISANELRLLTALASRPDQVIDPPSLIAEVWGHTHINQSAMQNLFVHISHTRKKLGTELGDAYKGAVRTRFGAGYYAVSLLGGY